MEDNYKYKTGDEVYYVYNNKVYSGRIDLLLTENRYYIAPCVIHMKPISEDFIFKNKQDAINFCSKRSRIIKQIKNKVIKFLKDNDIYYYEFDNIYGNDITIDLVKCANILANKRNKYDN